MASHSLHAPKPQRAQKWPPEALLANGDAALRRQAAPPAYSFPTDGDDGFEYQLSRRTASRNDERKRTTSVLSARSASARSSSHLAALAAPPYSAPHGPAEGPWPSRNRSRASVRPDRPLSPADSDFSATSTVRTSAKRPLERSITAVLAEQTSSTSSKREKPKHDALLRRWTRWMHKTGKKRWTVPSLVIASLLVKSVVGLGPFSGACRRP